MWARSLAFSSREPYTAAGIIPFQPNLHSDVASASKKKHEIHIEITGWTGPDSFANESWTGSNSVASFVVAAGMSPIFSSPVTEESYPSNKIRADSPRVDAGLIFFLLCFSGLHRVLPPVWTGKIKNKKIEPSSKD